MASAAALAGIVQTPALSELFGCTPLGPVGWTVATSWSTAGSVGAALIAPVVDRVIDG